MKNRLLLIAGLVILAAVLGLAGMGLVLSQRDEEAALDSVAFLIGNGESMAAIGCQKDREEEIYNLFLPSYAGERNIWIRLRNGRQLKLGEDIYTDGQEVALPAGEAIYEAVLCSRRGEELEKAMLRVMYSKNLPAVFINTASGNMDYVYSHKDNKEAGYAQIISEAGEMEGFEKLEYITGRGNTSWEAVKRAFSIKFKDRVGLLGMDPAKSWALIANYYDGAYIRNMTGMEIARLGGIEFTPDSEFFDLYLNGEYAGLYQAMEKIETGSGRLDVSNACLLEIDYSERAALEEQYFLLPNKKPVVIHSPKALGEERMREIEAFFSELIRTLESEEYVNPETGKDIFEYIDKKSWAKTYVMEEILQNMDFGVTSHYMYLLPEGEGFKLYEGPLWDLDNTLGRGDKQRGRLFASQCELNTNNLGRWYARLYQNEEFYQELVWQYQECFKEPLTWFAGEGVEAQEALLEASVRMDTVLWKGKRSVFMGESTREEHIAFLVNYLEEKADFLNGVWNYTKEAKEQWERDRVYTLPALLEEEWLEEAADTDKDEGLKTLILNGHGYIMAAAMLAALVLVILLDRRKNGK